MSKLNDLIKNLCPHGVEFKKLGELCRSIKDGMHNLPKSSLDSGEIPILSASNIYDNRIDYNSKRFVDSETFERENKRTNVEIGDVLLTIVATIGRSAVVKDEQKILLQRSVCTLKPSKKILSGYLKYCLDTNKIQNYMFTNAHGSAQAGLYLNKVEQILIPVPPLEVQKEIVSILDTFTELTNELIEKLSEELSLRKKQYKFYRDKLLTFGDEVEFKKLGDLVEKISKISWNKTEKIFEYIDLSSVSCENSKIVGTQLINKKNAPDRAQQILKTDDVLFGTTRPTLKRYCIISEKYNEQICSTGFCVLRANKNLVLPQWIYFNLSTKKFFDYVSNTQHGTSYPIISDREVKNFEIPIPPIEEQARIVKILDRFDKLCNDLSEGLPAEISLRKKQYEFYRDKLLKFEELKVK